MENVPASLVVQCLRSVVINMESMPRNELQYLPSPYRELFVPDSFIQAKFNLWPRNVKGENTTIMVKKEMIISEILLLLKHKLKLARDLEVRLFKSSLPLEDDDVFLEENGDYDCVIGSSKFPTDISSVARFERHHGVIRTGSKKDVSTATFYSVNFHWRQIFIVAVLCARNG